MYRPPPLRKNRGWGDSLRSRRLEVVGRRKNGGHPRARPFPLSPATSKRLLRRLVGGWCVHRLTLKWQSAQGTDTYLAGFCERQGLVRLDCKPLFWKMSPQRTGRRRKSSLRSCQYPGHTLDHTGKITTVAGRHVVNFQIASEISQSFAPSCKYHSFFFFMQKISKRTEIF